MKKNSKLKVRGNDTNLIILSLLSLFVIAVFITYTTPTKDRISQETVDNQSIYTATYNPSEESSVETKVIAEKLNLQRKTIKLNDNANVSDVQEVITSQGGEIISINKDLLVAHLPKENEEEILSNLEEEDIEEIEVDYPVYLTADSVDWGVERIEAQEVWNINKASGITVGVVDTGVDYTHQELNGRYIGGYDAVNEDNDPIDDHGHGTHVAGIVAANTNGIGVVGVAPEVNIASLKVLGADGTGYLSDIIQAIDWAMENNVSILNFSLGTTYDSSLLKSKLMEAANSGILLVAAAGNNNGGSVLFPAAYDTVVAVSATDRHDKIASFSALGAELAAPGVSITSSVPGGGYATWSGTSMASPHVAGTMALMLANGQTNIRDNLRNTAIDLGEQGVDNYFGYGLVHARPAALGEDVLSPVITFLNPSNNSYLNDAVEIQLEVQDENLVDEVKLYINSVEVNTWLSEPYTFVWNTSDQVDGEYVLLARAIDEHDNEGEVQIKVNIGEEPEVIPTPRNRGVSEEHRQDNSRRPEKASNKSEIPEVTNGDQRNQKPTSEDDSSTLSTEESDLPGNSEKRNDNAKGKVKGASDTNQALINRLVNFIIQLLN